MAWRILITDTAVPDLRELDDPERAIAEVFDWVSNGPPCEQERGLGRAVVYDHRLENGVRVQYFIGVEPHAYVAILRVRRPSVEPPP